MPNLERLNDDIAVSTKVLKEDKILHRSNGSVSTLIAGYYRSAIRRWAYQDIALGTASIAVLCVIIFVYTLSQVNYLNEIHQNTAMGVVFFTFSSLIFLGQSMKDLITVHEIEVTHRIEILNQEKRAHLIIESNVN